MSRRVWLFWIIPASALNILDIGTTYIGLSIGFSEQNPFVQSLIEQRGLLQGLLAFLGFRFLIVGVGALLCWIAKLAKEIFPISGNILSWIIYAGLGLDLVIGVFVVIMNFALLASTLAS